MATDLLYGSQSMERELNSSTSAESQIPNGEPRNLAAFAQPAQWNGPETILLVEDEAFVRKATAEALESAGYRLLIATSAAEALEAHRKRPQSIDLLLTDVVMPGMNGCDLAAEFGSLCPHTRVLLMTGHQEPLAECERSRHGTKYLAKPFSIHRLLSKVREVLDKNQFEAEAQV
jgi:DNA-binding NtrC family response regulator